MLSITAEKTAGGGKVVWDIEKNIKTAWCKKNCELILICLPLSLRVILRTFYSNYVQIFCALALHLVDQIYKVSSHDSKC